MTRPALDAIYNLSPLQEGMLFHTLRTPASGVYVVQYSCLLKGDLDVVAFERAWQSVVDRQSVLRTAFIWEELEEAVQVVQAEVKLSLGHQDWRGMTVQEQAERLDVYLKVDRGRGFDLVSAPLMRLILIQIADDAYQFVWSFHHILLDGWSVPIILKEVFSFYEAFSRGEELELAPAPPYREYIAWLRRRDLTNDEAFWRDMLKGLTEPGPFLETQPAENSTEPQRCAMARALLSAGETTALQVFARQSQLTLNTVMQGAWALLLGLYTNRRDVVYGTTLSGRSADLQGIESMVGLFINTLPVRVQLPPDATLSTWLRRIQDEQTQLREFEYTPLVKAQQWSEIPSGAQLFETILVFENYPLNESLRIRPAGLEINDLQNFEHTSFPLAMVITPGQELLVKLLYLQQLFEASLVAQLVGHFINLLKAMVADPDQRLSDVSILTEAERSQLLIDWNDTRRPYPSEASVAELFEAQVERRPQAIALVFGEAQVSYLELNQRANQLAHYLIAAGVGPEVRVGIYMERSLEMVVAMLAILKAGGAYVPLDLEAPTGRLDFMLQDASTALLLTQQRLIKGLPESQRPVVCVDAPEDGIASRSTANPFLARLPDSLAYVIYTSGSTGQPKGVCVNHRAIARLVKSNWYASLTEQETILQLAPISFDASTFEIWGSLLNGGTLAIYSGQSVTVHELGEAIERHQVTTLWLTAGLFHLIVDEGAQQLKAIKQLLAGGDVLSVSHVEKFLQEATHSKLINGYGPTESTTFACCHAMNSSEAIGASVPIGRPIANTQVYLADAMLRPVPVGVRGELYIGGDGLARGYLGRPELTAEKFIPDNFSRESGSRLYRTGDLARYRANSEIEFHGRTDHQIKVRGFRIELEEIEATLGQCPTVRRSVITAASDSSGEKRLIAYVVTEDERATTVDELRDFLQGKLPDYMMPSIFVMLDTLPLTPNGKVDRRALPSAEGLTHDLQEGYIAPRTLVEDALAGIWGELLGVERVGMHDDFFDLGGHSLLATRLISRVRERFQIELPVNIFLSKVFSADASTIEGMAKALEEYEIQQAEAQEIDAILQELDGLSDDEVRALLEDEEPGVAGDEK